MTNIVSINVRQDKEDELLTAQLVANRARRLQEAKAANPDTEAPPEDWQQYAHGADIRTLSVASHSVGEVMIKGVAQAAEIIDINSNSPTDPVNNSTQEFTVHPIVAEPHSQHVAR